MWFQDSKLANILINNSEIGRKHIFTDGASVHLLNLTVFENDFSKAKEDSFARQRDALSEQMRVEQMRTDGNDSRISKATSKAAAITR